MTRTARALALLLPLTGVLAGCANDAPPSAAEDAASSDAGADAGGGADASALAVGEHHVLLAERGQPAGFYRADFSKGHALYVIISTDWDFPDVDDRVLEQHRTLHQAHPELHITHLIAPYTFTDPAVS